MRIASGENVTSNWQTRAAKPLIPIASSGSPPALPPRPTRRRGPTRRPTRPRPPRGLLGVIGGFPYSYYVSFFPRLFVRVRIEQNPRKPPETPLPARRGVGTAGFSALGAPGGAALSETPRRVFLLPQGSGASDPF